MEDDVTALYGLPRDIDRGQIAFLKIDTGNAIEIASSARDQTIDNAHGVAAPNQFFREMRSDESGAAGDEVLSHALLI
jgi:hypothetical protein